MDKASEKPEKSHSIGIFWKPFGSLGTFQTVSKDSPSKVKGIGYIVVIVFVNESVNNEIPEKKVCLGVYTPKHTFFFGCSYYC